jgi:uncharacterized DUF497 family protein
MQINDVIWLEQVVEKIESKHHISPEEVEEVLYNRPKYRKAQKGRIHGEDLYYAYGQTDSGRYVFVVFIYKYTREALIVSARDMDRKERKRYAKK